MASSDPAERILELMREYHRAGVASVTVDDLARALKMKRTVVSVLLQRMMKCGQVHHARKNPRSAQPRFTLNGGQLK